jgi:hypothetical protein
MKSFNEYLSPKLIKLDLPSYSSDIPLDLLESMGETTQNASVTELFPCLAFNKKFRPSNVEDFKKFLYKLNIKSAKTSYAPSDADAAAEVIEKLSTMEERFVKMKMENAIGITNFLYDLNTSKPIKKVVWGYRAKPSGVPKNHAGDIFVFFQNKEILGISLKAGTTKSKEPLLNSYVKTQLVRMDKESALKPMEDELWDAVYSKLPNIESVASKSTYASGDRKVTAGIRQIYLDYHIENEEESNNLYAAMVRIQRTHVCKALNELKLEDFKKWVYDNFNLQKPAKVPLILVKAVGKTAEQKGDDLASLLPLVTSFNAYLNKSSVQEWFIDIDTPDEMKKLKMTIRSDASVREGKSLAKLGRLAKFSMLKLQYSGVVDR